MDPLQGMTASFVSNLATVYWNEQARAVEVVWNGLAEDKPFQAALDAGLALLEQHRAPFWLAHTQELKVLTEAQQNWANDVWFPKALAAGLRRMALIIPRSAIAKMSFEAILTKVPDTGFVRHYFDDAESARRWFERQQVLLDAGVN